MDDSSKSRPISAGYAYGQIAKALVTADTHHDEATRQRAQAKIERWLNVLNGMFNQSIVVGSRTPVKDVPAWATLEVVTGGFATGNLLAGGPLQPHEELLFANLPSFDGDRPRLTLNRYFLSDKGLRHLTEMLTAGCYLINVPEEGALLVVAWLLKHGFGDEARDLILKIGPYFDQLRFYPLPTDSPRESGSLVYLYTAGDAQKKLKKTVRSQNVQAQEETIAVWLPLYDEMLGLFLETVQGDPPNLRPGPNGEKIYVQNGRYPIVGGWPCQQYPDDWVERALALVERAEKARLTYQQSSKPDRKKDRFYQLSTYLRDAATVPELLSGRDVGRIRLILACAIAKRGIPGSSEHRAIRFAQQQQIDILDYRQIAKMLVARLADFPKDEGIDQYEQILRPISAEEAYQWNLPEETEIPNKHRRKVMLSARDSIVGLIDRGFIKSSESMARVLPQITAEIGASGFGDPDLRQVYASIYRAFRQRRSLLLLNLESQVKLEELPWVEGINLFRETSLSTRQLAYQTFEEVVRLALLSFPQTITPNKLLQELRALAKNAQLEIPLVDEIAADIFMGDFSQKFIDAALWAANMLEGSLYETYYGLDYKMVRDRLTSETGANKRYNAALGRRFLDLCLDQAGLREMGGTVAANGMVLEQEQIYTTHNLAVLFDVLDLKERLGDDQLERLARQTFQWVCRRLQVDAPHRHARLIAVKNSAYAWRQMVFFLAQLPAERVDQTVAWMVED
ncbi:MAG: hypothetical protein AAF633_25065, partial [Chloroflexota bacterium]